MASGDKDIARIQRHIEAIFDQVEVMRHSIEVYISNPRKYEPQLENLAEAAMNTQRSAEIILRTMGVPKD